MVLRDLETNGERNPGLHILKSRGMASSNHVREFLEPDTSVQNRFPAPRAEFSGEEAIITRTVRKDAQRGAVLALDEAAMGRSRKGDAAKPHVVKTNGKHLHRRVGARE